MPYDPADFDANLADLIAQKGQAYFPQFAAFMNNVRDLAVFLQTYAVGYAADGTLAAPGWAFALDPNTGFYRPAADKLAVSAGGALAGTFDAAGFNGPIGQTTPAFANLLKALLDDGSAAAPALAFRQEPTTGFRRSAAGKITLRILGVDIGTWSGTGLDGMAIGQTTKAAVAATALTADTLNVGAGALYVSGGVAGVGTTVPISYGSPGALTVSSPASAQLVLEHSAAAAGKAIFRLESKDGALSVISSDRSGGNGTTNSATWLKADTTAGTLSINSRLVLTGAPALTDVGNVPQITNYNSNGALMVAGGTGSLAHIVFYAGSPLQEVMRADATNRTLQVGLTTSTPYHRIWTPAAIEGDFIASFGATQASVIAANALTAGYNAAAAALFLRRNSTTSRSINAAGTINASGADAAEYVEKSPSTGTIQPGDVCGIDAAGKLTQQWADAHSVVVKSTNPHIVGGDTWGQECGPRPEPPTYQPPAYEGPQQPEPVPELAAYVAPTVEMPVEPVRQAEEPDDAYALRVTWWQAQCAAAQQTLSTAVAAAEATYATVAEWHAAEVAAYETAFGDWQSAQQAYTAAIEEAETAHAGAIANYTMARASWEQAYETARQRVDRVAFCGRVPVNLAGPWQAGQIVVACEAVGGGIEAVAVDATVVTSAHKVIGKIWGPYTGDDSGRPYVAVGEGSAQADIQRAILARLEALT